MTCRTDLKKISSPFFPHREYMLKTKKEGKREILKEKPLKGGHKQNIHTMPRSSRVTTLVHQAKGKQRQKGL